MVDEARDTASGEEVDLDQMRQLCSLVALCTLFAAMAAAVLFIAAIGASMVSSYASGFS